MTKWAIKTVSFTPSFRGKHNILKTKSWLVLASCNKWLTVLELASKARVNYSSLLVSMAKWHRWEYVLRNDKRHPYSYKLAVRGLKWLERHRKSFPPGLEAS